MYTRQTDVLEETHATEKKMKENTKGNTKEYTKAITAISHTFSHYIFRFSR